ncbi:transcriptional regulator [Mariniblastus fucicola]|uniref:Uncharacterized protein n=1 Tax=Mariniblastus fucicola TaxID=980251 RepID=A0A5B9P9X2_9BACT|nr:transcriptional regulator [Mariniblastus fucicola]QEG23557.1 hypothetical protein MFFC18_34580 [Mariniblastus fucicola]
MDLVKFNKMTDSLRQYRRAELKDFSSELGESPASQLYVDPLQGDAVLATVMSSNTTFLLGRKGTGKSTVFAKAQSEIREKGDLISVYVDVKSLYDLASAADIAIKIDESLEIDPAVYQAHLIRKHFLGRVIEELISELQKSCDKRSLIERWIGKKRGYQELQRSLSEIGKSVAKAELRQSEVPILQTINASIKSRNEKQVGGESACEGSGGVEATASLIDTSAKISGGVRVSEQDFSKTLEDQETYNTYSNAVVKSFPFSELLTEITDLLEGAGLTRVVVFFDDFSELQWSDQRLFVDVVLSPLNNSSNEKVKLKIAGYPGRVYFGKIDPSKVDTLHLDFSRLNKSNEIQSAESAAIEYTARLLRKRFEAFGLQIEEYFEVSSQTSIDDYFRLIFQVTSNVPRTIGQILHRCYLDSVSRGKKITGAQLRLAAEKYYNDVTKQYFEISNRFALEPFEQKLDRHNQRLLLSRIIEHARDVRRRIRAGELGGSYFTDISNPPTSHFAVSPQLEKMLGSLELNFFLTKYADMRDKNGNDVSIYSLSLGLCEAEKMQWGYPPGREYRNYFTQRCFDYNRKIKEFLAATQTIRCDECGACHSIEMQEHFEFFNWRCKDCNIGNCAIVQLSDDFEAEVLALDQALMLEPVELKILSTLFDEDLAMRAGEISVLIDSTYQLIGKRTSKLHDMGLVEKKEIDGHRRSQITDKAKEVYFS